MSLDSQKATELIETNTRLTDVFLDKEQKIEQKLKEFQDWRESQAVAFSANHFVWHDQQETKLHTVLKADNVVLNLSNGYDKETGIFTAPTDGVYHFSAKVFINTALSEIDDTHYKWHDDMVFNINRYDRDKTPLGNGSNGDKIGEMWIGQVGESGPDRLHVKWNRNEASDSVNHALKKGEKVCVEFVTWNGATEDDGLMASYTFSGHRIA